MKMKISIGNIGTIEFRSILEMWGPNHAYFVVFQISNISAPPSTSHRQSHTTNSEVFQLEEEFASVFRKDISAGLPSVRSVDHAIYILPNQKPPRRPLFQLSFAKMMATIEYDTNLLRKGKIRPRTSPYGSPFFCETKK